MNMTEMQNAVDDAKATLARAEMLVPQMVRLIRGRLRASCRSYSDLHVLADLKRELRDFNPQRRTWK